MLTKDIMSTQVITISQDCDVQELGLKLTDMNISGCPVVDHGGHLVGVVSLYDIAFHHGKIGKQDAKAYWYADPQLPSGYGVEDPSDTKVKVSQIMTPAIYSVEEDTPIAEVCDYFTKGEIHRVLVTRGKSLVGIVTGTDLIKYLSRLLKTSEVDVCVASTDAQGVLHIVAAHATSIVE